MTARRSTPRLALLLAAVLALSLLTASDAEFVEEVVTFSDPAQDANGLNAQGEKCCGSGDVSTNETTSQADADILEVRLSPMSRDGVRTGWQVAITLTGELGENVVFVLDGHSASCDRIGVAYEPATVLEAESTELFTSCNDESTTAELAPPTVDGSTFTIAVPDEAMPPIIADGEALEFIWLQAYDLGVRDAADADPRAGFLLRDTSDASPSASPTPRPSESSSPEPSESSSPEPSESSSPEPSESSSPEPSESSSPEPSESGSTDDDDEERQRSSSEPRDGPEPATGAVTRVQGSDRSATAAAVAERAHPDRADTVVVASAADYPDALAGAPLAGLHAAPVLLTGPDGLGDEALRQIRRLRPGRALVLGGTAALSDQVVADLEQAGVARVERVAGENRFATAATVARRVELEGSVETVYVVEGGDADPSRGWPDAVAASSSAALLERPVLLVTTEDLPDATRAFLSEHDVQRAIVVGGEAAVSTAVERELAGLVGDVERLAGADRFATSRRVADAALAEGADARTTWFATGSNWPDALAAGPAAAAQGGVLLLSPTDDSAPARAWIADNGCLDATLVGGEAALSARVEGEVREALDAC